MSIGAYFSGFVGRGLLAGVVCLLATLASAGLPQVKLQNPQEGNLTVEMGSSVSLDGDTMIVGSPAFGTQDKEAGAVLVYRADGLGGWTLEAELISSDVKNSPGFGTSVAISGNTAIVGSGTNSAFVYTRSGETWTEQAILTYPDAEDSAIFGRTVAISGDTAIIGDPVTSGVGSAYIFTRSGENWTQEAELTPSDADHWETFGHSVAISGDTAIVGGWFQLDFSGHYMAGHIYTRSKGVWTLQEKLTVRESTWHSYYPYPVSVAISGDKAVLAASGEGTTGWARVYARADGVWSEQAELISSGVSESDIFAVTVALSGDTVIVGALDGHGYYRTSSAYLFTGYNDEWSQEAKLTTTDDQVGYFTNYASVSISGDTAILGAIDYPIDFYQVAGSTYSFTRTDGLWTQQAKLDSSLAAEGDYFGGSVSVSGDTGIIGVHRDGDEEYHSGSAYIYTQSGGVWSQQAKLKALDGGKDSWFGSSVAISEDIVIVGAHLDDDGGENSGAAYVFVLTDGVWTQEAKLTPSGAAEDQRFGNSVAISGDTAIIGASGESYWPDEYSGSAYVFTRSDGVWTEQAKLTSFDAEAMDFFGSSVALYGDIAVIGAFGDDDGGEESGSAYVFERSGEVWSQQAKLISSDSEEDDNFGISVALSGDTAIIGACGGDSEGEDTGAVYVYTRSGEDWIEQAKLTASDAGLYDDFGISVALSGDTAIIGAHGSNEIGYNSGSAYLFRRSEGVWTQHEKLTANDAAEGDEFGKSVATDGVHVLVGAPRKSDPELDSGAAYILSLIPVPSSFSFTFEDQNNPFFAWNFVLPTEFTGTITGNFDDANERLQSVTSTNTGAFGFWESPAFEVSDSASDVIRGLFLRGEVGEDSLFRAFWTLSSDDAVDVANLPTVRVRSGSSNYAVTSELLSTSRGNGDFSPSDAGNLYDQYFALPAEDNVFRLSFDVINFDPTNAAVATLNIEEVTLEYIGRDALGSATQVANLDFAGNDNGFTARNASPDLVVPETFTSTADGLLIRGVEPSPAQGGNSDIIFGYWGVETDIPFTGGKLYRVTWTIGSDAAAGQELEVPTFRLRVNDSSLKFASLLHVNSYNETARVPVAGSSQAYDLWLVAPEQIDGSLWNFSLDYLVVGGAPTSEDDPTIGLYLENINVEEYELD